MKNSFKKQVQPCVFSDDWLPKIVEDGDAELGIVRARNWVCQKPLHQPYLFVWMVL